MNTRVSDHTHETSPYRNGERSPATHAEPSATDAVERALDAGQRLVSERIELAKLDVQDAVAEKLSLATRVVVPGLFAFGGWWILMAGVIVLLNAVLVLPATLAIVGGAHVVVAGAIAAGALHRARSGAHVNGTRNGGARVARGTRP